MGTRLGTIEDNNVRNILLYFKESAKLYYSLIIKVIRSIINTIFIASIDLKRKTGKSV